MGWMVRVGPAAILLAAAGCRDLQIEPVKIEIADLAVAPCDTNILLSLPPNERKVNCYEVQGTAFNPSTRELRKVNLYGVIEDAEGTIVREGRIGSLPDLGQGKKIPFLVRVFFTQKLREPLKLDAFRAKGLT